jgi:murein DD-endopeptidase MepM/ murein hydrolase activator NlpD
MQVGAAVRRVAVWSSVAVVATAVTIGSAPSTASASGFSCASAPGYDVRPGDSWYGIAERIEVSVRSLVDANGATLDSVLTPGDRLCLPAGTDPRRACADTYTIRHGDSWAAIGRRAGSTAGAVAGANGVDIDRAIHPGDVVCLPAGTSLAGASESSQLSDSSGSSRSSGGSYTVVRGDSWAVIAARAGVTMGALVAVNDAASTDLLLPGDALRLPEGADIVAAVSVRLDAAPTQGPCGYLDTWGDARGGARSHAGTDIFSGSGNYVYAVVDGRLTGRVWDGAGRNAGNAWTLTGPDNTRYFYAHLADFAPDLQVGSHVDAGEIIGWVGSTGNSSAAHLHFEVRPGGGPPVDPYPILRAQGGCNDGRPYTQPGGWVPDTIR